MRIIATTEFVYRSKRTIVLAYKVQAQADQTIPTGRDTIFLCNENFVYKGFRCNPSATDKPNVAVNTRQNYSSGAESTYSHDSAHANTLY